MSVIQILLVGIALATAGVDGASAWSLPGQECTGNRAGNGKDGNCEDGGSYCVDGGDYAAHGSVGVCSTPVGYGCHVKDSYCTALPDGAEQECVADESGKETGVCTEKVDEPADEPVVEPAKCKEGWIRLSSCDDTEPVCVQMQRPIKFISWFHMAYECDAIGGFLPEPSTTGLNQQFNFLLKGYEQLYGKTMLFLGASDLTHKGEWKWQNRRTAVSDLVWDEESSAENLDCMAKVSTSSEKYTAINCEADSMETQVAFMCMRKME